MSERSLTRWSRVPLVSSAVSAAAVAALRLRLQREPVQSRMIVTCTRTRALRHVIRIMIIINSNFRQNSRFQGASHPALGATAGAARARATTHTTTRVR